MMGVSGKARRDRKLEDDECNKGTVVWVMMKCHKCTITFSLEALAYEF